jgi:hypothetical protein
MKLGRTGAVALLAALLFSAASSAQKPAEVGGKWELNAQGPQGPATSTMTLTQDGEKIKGAIQRARGEIRLEGTVKGKQISFTVKAQSPQGEVVVEYTGTVEGDSMKGVRKGPRGETEWTAKRMK